MYGEQTEEFKKSELAMIKEIEKLLPDYDIYLQFGTLLGAIRDGGLIDHDNDVDVCYMSKFHTAKEVEKEMKEIYRYLIDKNLLSNYFTTEKEGKFWHEVKGKKLNDEIISPFGQAHIRLKKRDVDFFTSWIDEKGNYYTCQWGCLGKECDILPYKTIVMYDMEFKIPSNADVILESLFGDWRVPKEEKSKRIRKPYLKEWLNESKV